MINYFIIKQHDTAMGREGLKISAILCGIDPKSHLMMKRFSRGIRTALNSVGLRQNKKLIFRYRIHDAVEPYARSNFFAWLVYTVNLNFINKGETITEETADFIVNNMLSHCRGDISLIKAFQNESAHWCQNYVHNRMRYAVTGTALNAFASLGCSLFLMGGDHERYYSNVFNRVLD